MKYVSEYVRPLRETLSKSEKTYLNEWLSNRDWISPKIVWILGLKKSADDYDNANSVRVSDLIRKELGWVKNGHRAHYEGERHWIYVRRPVNDIEDILG